MSDARPLPDFLGNDSDEELVFEDPFFAEETVMAEAAPVVAEEVPAIAEPRRTVRRGRKALEATPPPIVADPEPARPEPPVSADAAAAASPEDSAGVASAPFPPHGAASADTKIPMLMVAITIFALLTSLLSLGGLIMVSRTLTHAEADRARAAEERATFEGVPALVARLAAASSHLDAAEQRLSAASPSGPPATIADIRHELDMLKIALAAHQPDGMDALNGTTRDGFSEISTRLDHLQARLTGPQPSH
ncbi:hypothetical protein [Sphingomonas abietis]|uniref:Uncharacterized protein n=1 Tax=Sphingomonas abietis TaxID=3012344 RepID=A0ABY7NNB0_9SPHN|nr:hypothetical protein [Sphingomonas abietis]WBO22123.1 hypothetical protein PBT88_18515 [Sphingomonas abietis]